MKRITTTRITIRTPQSRLSPQHARSLLRSEHVNKIVYFEIDGVTGETAHLWLTENQVRWLVRWLQSRLAQSTRNRGMRR